MNDSVFYTKGGVNGFDSLEVDLDRLYKDHPLSQAIVPNGTPSALDHRKHIYRNPLIPLKSRLHAWQAAFRGQQDNAWFEEFNSYWTALLGGRPLWSPLDVYFLKNLYRIKFQQNTLPDSEDASIHLRAWQRPELLYTLMHQLTKETYVHDVSIVLKALRLAGKTRGASILEYGCGLAPLTYWALKFIRSARSHRFHLADLASLPFHYAVWRLRGQPNVQPFLLRPENEFRLETQQPQDVIFCIQVFEHLNKPLETAQLFHKLLNKNGVLVFDFLLTKGEALDSIQATRERSQVIDFINANFAVQAELDAAKGIDLTFALKRG
jgi:SAM-dependent methyltransferase